MSGGVGKSPSAVRRTEWPNPAKWPSRTEFVTSVLSPFGRRLAGRARLSAQVRRRCAPPHLRSADSSKGAEHLGHVGGCRKIPLCGATNGVGESGVNGRRVRYCVPGIMALGDGMEFSGPVERFDDRARPLAARGAGRAEALERRAGCFELGDAGVARGPTGQRGDGRGRRVELSIVSPEFSARRLRD
jgi:hypothetical protein